MRGSSPPLRPLSERLRPKAAKVLQPIGRALMRMGITADALTFFGVVLAALVGLLAATGHLFWAGSVLILSGPMDALDGTVARLSGVTGKFGAFWDSTADRYSEGFVLLGILVYGLGAGDHWIVVLSFVTIWGSLLVSYTRSRAETLGVDCKVGLLTRLERVLITIAMLLIDPVRPDIPILTGLILLAIGSHLTVIQRVAFVRRTLREQGP